MWMSIRMSGAPTRRCFANSFPKRTLLKLRINANMSLCHPMSHKEMQWRINLASRSLNRSKKWTIRSHPLGLRQCLDLLLTIRNNLKILLPTWCLKSYPSKLRHPPVIKWPHSTQIKFSSILSRRVACKLLLSCKLGQIISFMRVSSINRSRDRRIYWLDG
jgi:hypothetical protein